MLGAGLAAVVVVSVPALRSLDRDVTVQTHEIELLQRVPMLRLLPVPAIEYLAAVASQRRVPEGEVVCAEGEPGDAYFVIADGRAEVTIAGQRRRDLEAGDGFGEIALLRPLPRTATVRAVTDVSLRVLDGPAFIRAVGGYRPSASAADAEIRRVNPDAAPPGEG